MRGHSSGGSRSSSSTKMHLEDEEDEAKDDRGGRAFPGSSPTTAAPERIPKAMPEQADPLSNPPRHQTDCNSGKCISLTRSPSTTLCLATANQSK